MSLLQLDNLAFALYTVVKDQPLFKTLAKIVIFKTLSSHAEFYSTRAGSMCRTYTSHFNDFEKNRVVNEEVKICL